MQTAPAPRRPLAGRSLCVPTAQLARPRKVSDLAGTLTILLLEPFAAISDPPCNEYDWDGCSDAPPQRQQEVRQQTQEDEHRPEDLALHEAIVGLRPLASPIG